MLTSSGIVLVAGTFTESPIAWMFVCKQRLLSGDMYNCKKIAGKLPTFRRKVNLPSSNPNMSVNTSVTKSYGFVPEYRVRIAACSNLHSQQRDTLKSHSTALRILLFSSNTLTKVKT
jgi:hypothetical protein